MARTLIWHSSVLVGQADDSVKGFYDVYEEKKQVQLHLRYFSHRILRFNICSILSSLL